MTITSSGPGPYRPVKGFQGFSQLYSYSAQCMSCIEGWTFGFEGFETNVIDLVLKILLTIKHDLTPQHVLVHGYHSFNRGPCKYIHIVSTQFNSLTPLCKIVEDKVLISMYKSSVTRMFRNRCIAGQLLSLFHSCFTEFK